MAIKRFHEIAGIQFPVSLHLLKLEMMSIKRELAGLTKKAVPVTARLLTEIYRHVNLQSDQELVCYVALLVGFYLFLRQSNLAPDTCTTFNHKEQLTREDVWTTGKLILVNIKWSKTNQYRQRELILPLIPARNKVICPVFRLKVLYKFLTKDVKSPLLSYARQGKIWPITTELLARNYKECFKKTGTDPDGFTLHGLRRGA